MLVGGACQPVPPGSATPGKGMLTGQVIDNPATARPGTPVNTHPGISITVQKAVPSGSYKLSADSPERVAYQAGDKVAEVVSGADGRFSIELPAGTYFVRGFGGEKVYSDQVFVEIKAGSTTEIKLPLNFGV